MKIEWQTIFEKMKKTLNDETLLPAISTIASRKHDPFRVLISTLISLRTKDQVTIEASKRLFSRATTPFEMLLLTEEEIGVLIYPAGFYRVKSKNILAISKILVDEYHGEVPNQKELLMALPGVGTKTANLTLNLGFNIEAICVDIHVHRISNRMGWIATQTPEESEKALEKIMPRKYWIPLNELLVTYGQQICRPISPFCSRCGVYNYCQRIGVERSR